MNFEFKHIIASLIMFIIVMGCEKDASIAPNCIHKMFYVSSAVCSESSNAAAVRDESGELYVARNLFLHIGREEVTVDLEIHANFELVGEPIDQSQCGQLLVGPEITVSCFSVAE